MTGLSVLLLGIGLGLRHATDADHVVVVSTLVQREPGVWRAARIAALWGAGHTVTFLALGLLIVLAEVRIPEAFERGAELLVALMLIGFGLWHLVRSRGTGAGGRLAILVHATAGCIDPGFEGEITLGLVNLGEQVRGAVHRHASEARSIGLHRASVNG